MIEKILKLKITLFQDELYKHTWRSLSYTSTLFVQSNQLLQSERMNDDNILGFSILKPKICL